MSTFLRKRPPYTPRQQSNDLEDDLPIVGPASEDDDFPVLSPETGLAHDDFDDEDFPVVGPAADTYSDEDLTRADGKFDTGSGAADSIKATTVSSTSSPLARQFTPSAKIRLPQAPAWIQEQAASYSNEAQCELPKTIPIQLENAIQVIINNEMAEAESRIKQQILNELKNYFKNN
jgi:hypothetical protein